MAAALFWLVADKINNSKRFGARLTQNYCE